MKRAFCPLFLYLFESVKDKLEADKQQAAQYAGKYGD
jgi:hypothetical protein